MEVKDIIRFLKEVQKDKAEKRDELKKNINSDYLLAKEDFRVIENREDIVATLEHIITELNELQDRIITRNRGNIVWKS